jgi:hypothetical protein
MNHGSFYFELKNKAGSPLKRQNPLIWNRAAAAPKIE